MFVAYKLKWFSVHAGEFKTETGIIGNVEQGATDCAVEAVIRSVMRTWRLDNRPQSSYQAADDMVSAMVASTRLP